VIPPVAIHRVPPSYTATTRRIRLHGTPIFEATITATGDVENIRVIRSAHPDVDKAIVAALEQWKFRPASLNGKPVAVYYTLTVNIHPQ
jgi:periplasmic protein TonB